MKIQTFTTLTTAVFFALAAHGQRTGSAGASAPGANKAGGPIGSSAGTGTGTAPSPGSANNVGGFNTAPLAPTQPPIVTPANAQQSPIQNANGNTPVVGASVGTNLFLGSNNLGVATNNLGIATNNLGIATNNLGLGTNQLGFGQNQFQFRSNNGVAPLTPTGTTNNVILLK